MSVCLSFCPLFNNSSGFKNKKFLTLPNFLLRMKKILKIYPLSEHCWDNQYKNKFYALIKKSSYKPWLKYFKNII